MLDEAIPLILTSLGRNAMLMMALELPEVRTVYQSIKESRYSHDSEK